MGTEVDRGTDGVWPCALFRAGVSCGYTFTSEEGRRRRRRLRSRIWAAFVVLLGGLLLAPSLVRAQAQQPAADHVVALVEVMSLPAKLSDGHIRLRAKLAEVLAPKGWSLVPASLDGDCEHPASCAAEAARQTHARYLMRMSGAPNQDDGYAFVLELFATDAVDAKKTAAYCNYCDVDRMSEVAGRFALQLLANDSVRTALQAQPTVPPAAVVTPPIDKPTLITKAPEPEPAVWPPWVLIAAGAVAGGYGAWALAKDGAVASCRPSAVATSCSRYSSETLGIIGVAGGGALAVSGAIWAFLLQRSSPAKSRDPASSRD